MKYNNRKYTSVNSEYLSPTPYSASKRNAETLIFPCKSLQKQAFVEIRKPSLYNLAYRNYVEYSY